ncbi:nucleolar protein 12-domain-containing protein [Stachybotrys elegans]|uniref:Nucleolar protein 12-domain-containing protein n=1 Tax=Stachybotrys elegans TaxID=80388 RepID=A0A8K0SSB7_9HYPO|nr:nucleolar protein 12-domain-containing protein [Stachybotrys elegans]
MFAKPRPKKSILPPPSKKRKNTSAIEEISFDNDARQEFLTGFHKRKQQRIKHAQEEAAKKARQEKLETRKHIREERRREVEEHVQNVNKMLREAGAAVPDLEEESSEEEEAEEWAGFPDRPELEIIDHEEEYIDEDRYTTVTVESVSVSRDGLSKPEVPGENSDSEEKAVAATEAKEDSKPTRPKKKKKKFRYESRIERQLSNVRQKAKNSKSKARRTG